MVNKYGRPGARPATGWTSGYVPGLGNASKMDRPDSEEFEGIRTCWRCGVEFDSTLYKQAAPCPDCQLDVPGQWLKKTGQRGRLSKAEGELRLAEIKRLNALDWLDTEIAEELDIDPSTVGQWRKRHGIPTVSTIARPERWQWKDAEAHLAHARQLVTHRKKVGRGRKPGNSEGSFQRDSRGKKVGDD